MNGYLCRVLIWFGGVIRDRITWEAGVLGREVDNIYRKKICKTNLPLPPPHETGYAWLLRLDCSQLREQAIFRVFSGTYGLGRKMNKA